MLGFVLELLPFLFAGGLHFVQLALGLAALFAQVVQPVFVLLARLALELVTALLEILDFLIKVVESLSSFFR